MFINSAKIDALIIKYAVEHFFSKNYCQPQKTPYNASSLSRHRALSEPAERTKEKVKSLIN
ncbi:hypothetical protein CLH65_16080 [Proteus mirabilis]|nr:hypothetical protein CLH65_16080 [Proteus mirabilis]OAH93801.1 hypothetical protein AZH52_17320 [Proteus mirabilis]